MTYVMHARKRARTIMLPASSRQGWDRALVCCPKPQTHGPKDERARFNPLPKFHNIPDWCAITIHWVRAKH